jgi:hypothetical protein
MQVPLLHPLKVCAAYYYDYLLRHENDGATFEDADPTAECFYRKRELEGERFYEQLSTRRK